jgi:metal-responsive CopG/Arc/MetJ family transcriptional regulator
MKTAISIPDPLFKAAEHVAKDLGISRSELFQRAVASFLTEHKYDRVTEQLDAIYAQNPEASDVDPILATIQSASLAKEDWS